MEKNLVKLKCDDCGHENVFRINPGKFRKNGKVYSRKLWFDNECRSCTADFHFELHIHLKADNTLVESDNTVGATVLKHSIKLERPARLETVI